MSTPSTPATAAPRPRGFVQAPNVVVSDARLSDQALRLLLALMAWSWHNGNPCNRDLARQAGWLTPSGRPAVGRVKRALAELEALGYVRREIARSTAGYRVRQALTVHLPEPPPEDRGDGPKMDHPSPVPSPGGGPEMAQGWSKNGPSHGSKMDHPRGPFLDRSLDRIVKKENQTPSDRGRTRRASFSRLRPEATPEAPKPLQPTAEPEASTLAADPEPTPPAAPAPPPGPSPEPAPAESSALPIVAALAAAMTTPPGTPEAPARPTLRVHKPDPLDAFELPPVQSAEEQAKVRAGMAEWKARREAEAAKPKAEAEPPKPPGLTDDELARVFDLLGRWGVELDEEQRAIIREAPAGMLEFNGRVILDLPDVPPPPPAVKWFQTYRPQPVAKAEQWPRPGQSLDELVDDVAEGRAPWGTAAVMLERAMMVDLAAEPGMVNFYRKAAEKVFTREFAAEDVHDCLRQARNDTTKEPSKVFVKAWKNKEGERERSRPPELCPV